MVDNQPVRYGRLGPTLRRGWVAYQRRLDQAMAAEGFGDRRFPDGRVLRVCAAAATAHESGSQSEVPDGAATIAHIGRELGISRQGAAKIVAELRQRGFVDVSDSATSGREKAVRLTPLGAEYLATRARCARGIESAIEAEVGAAVFTALHRLVEALDVEGDQPRLRDYLRGALD